MDNMDNSIIIMIVGMVFSIGLIIKVVENFSFDRFLEDVVSIIGSTLQFLMIFIILILYFAIAIIFKLQMGV